LEAAHTPFRVLLITGEAMFHADHSFRCSLLILLAGLIAVPLIAQARQIPREHEGGIFVRLSAGIAGVNTSIDDGGEKTEFTEGGGAHNLALGGIAWKNIALHATSFGWAVRDPLVEVDGVDQGRFNGTASLNALGGGVTWYIMPVNIYISGSAGFSWLSLTQNYTRNSSVGIAFDLTVGKEWWVSDRWGLGVSVGLDGHSVPVEGIDGNWEGGSFRVLFSATFN
jgi:hypothetical protein